MCFYEVVWNGKNIGDGDNLDEALLAFKLVKPEDGNWDIACIKNNSNPHINRYKNFDSYLDNADCLETITVSALMIAKALEQVPD